MCAGLALTSKYGSGAVIVVVLVVLAFASPLDLRRRITRALVAIASFGVAALVTMPALVLRTSQVREAIRFQYAWYRVSATPTNYLQQLVSGTEVGWLITVLAVGGLILALTRPKTRVLTAGWIAFAIVLLIPLVASNYQQFRNVLPLVPFMAVLAAVALVAVVRAVARWFSAGPSQELAAIGVAAVLVVAAIGLSGSHPTLRPSLGTTDTRVQAVDWLVAHTRDDQRVLVADELRILPSELDRIPGHVTVASIKGEISPKDLAGYDTVVTAKFQPEVPGWSSAEPGAPTARFGVSSLAFRMNWVSNTSLVEIFTRSP